MTIMGFGCPLVCALCKHRHRPQNCTHNIHRRIHIHNHQRRGGAEIYYGWLVNTLYIAGVFALCTTTGVGVERGLVVWTLFRVGT